MTNPLKVKLIVLAVVQASIVSSCSNSSQKSSVSRTKASATPGQDSNNLKANRRVFVVESKTTRTSNAASLFASEDTLLDTLGKRYNLNEQDKDASSPVLNFPAVVRESAIKLRHGAAFWAIHSQNKSIYYGMLDNSGRLLQELFSSRINSLLNSGEISNVLAVRENDLYVCSESEIHRISFDKQRKSFSSNTLSLACGVVYVTKNDQIHVLSKDESEWTLAIYSVIDAKAISKHLLSLPQVDEDIIAFAVEDDLSKMVVLTKSSVIKYVRTETEEISP
jgi:hypothetical protein